jgi:hypothetical protein
MVQSSIHLGVTCNSFVVHCTIDKTERNNLAKILFGGGQYWRWNLAGAKRQKKKAGAR